MLWGCLGLPAPHCVHLQRMHKGHSARLSGSPSRPAAASLRPTRRNTTRPPRGRQHRCSRCRRTKRCLSSPLGRAAPGWASSTRAGPSARPPHPTPPRGAHFMSSGTTPPHTANSRSFFTVKLHAKNGPQMNQPAQGAFLHIFKTHFWARIFPFLARKK